MIKDLLPQFYADHGPDSITYDPVRSFVVNGHEIWWAEYCGRGDRSFTGRSVVCECDFTPSLGYGLLNKL
jgi:hypothetical protein